MVSGRMMMTIRSRRPACARGAAIIGVCLLGAAGPGGVVSAQAHPTQQAHPAQAIWTSVAPPVVAPRRTSGAVGPLVNFAQTWNNCGPASVAEVLAYWGVSRTQGQVQAVLRVDGPNRGMEPYGVPAYARSVGLRALVGVGGTAALVKALLSNGFPVIVSQQISVANRIGHYRPIEAYDDRQGAFVASDPYLGAGYRISYADFARIWSRSGQGFLVLYPPARQALLAAVLVAAGWDKVRAYQHDLTVAQARLAHPNRRVASTGGMASRWSAHYKGYAYLRLAWDALQAGRRSLARRDLQQAAAQGANPIEVRWISGELARPAGP